MHDAGDDCVLDKVRDIARARLAEGSERRLWEDLDDLLGLIEEPARADWYERLAPSVAAVCDDGISALYWAHEGGIRLTPTVVQSSTG